MIRRRDIQAFADRVAAEFRPARIILFGSYAYGKPTEDSDVDLLVLFAGTGREEGRALENRLGLPFPGFPMDILARSEGEVRRRLAMNDSFLKEITDNGEILSESREGVDRKGGRRLRTGTTRAARTKGARA